jgi:pyruvate/2-oxoglutarate/acetoin dehydrogenase E1 component
MWNIRWVWGVSTGMMEEFGDERVMENTDQRNGFIGAGLVLP